MSVPDDFGKVSAILSVFEELSLNPKNFCEEVENSLTALPRCENLALAREYMSASRPRATGVLRRVAEIELMFLDRESLFFELQNFNPEPLERCFLSEIKSRQRDLRKRDVRDALLYFNDSKIRKEFLLWILNNYLLDLLDLLLIRRFVMYPNPMSWAGEVSQRQELDIVDESIRLLLCMTERSRIQRSILDFKKNKITEQILPDFFIPLVIKIHPNVWIK